MNHTCESYETFARYDKKAIQAAAMAFIAYRGEQRCLKTLLQESELARNALAHLCELSKSVLQFAARRYRRQLRLLEFADIVQAGNEGLMVAAIKYEPSDGVTFLTVAYYWIKQRIHKLLARHNGRLMRIKWSARFFGSPGAAIHKYHTIENNLRQELSREPTSEEVQSCMPMCESELRQVQEFIKTDFTQALLPYNVASPDLRDNPAVLCQQTALRQQIQKAISILPKRYQRIITIHYGLDGSGDHSFSAVAVILSAEEGKKVTRQRLQQIEAKAFKILRKNGVQLGLNAMMRDLTGEPFETFVPRTVAS